LRPYDLAANAIKTWRVRNIPPDQLLRQVFETCPDFATARAMLERTPVARPVIYSLAGTLPGERCVIERTETDFETRSTATVAANDWHTCRDPWEARIGGDLILTCRYEEAGENSRCRRETMQSFSGSLMREPFGWLTAPINNRFTRLAVEMCPARGVLRVMGLERIGEEMTATPVTAIREVAALPSLAA
jgi:hypothetical protein